MDFILRKEILQSLPKGAAVYYKLRRDNGTVLARKLRDYNTGMRIYMNGYEVFVSYRKLSCEQIINAQEVAERLSGTPKFIKDLNKLNAGVNARK